MKIDSLAPAGKTENVRCYCPRCGNIMQFVFPATQKDPDVERVIWRLQRCENGCGWTGDVVSEVQYIILRVGHEYTLDGYRHKSLRDLLADMGILGLPY